MAKYSPRKRIRIISASRAFRASRAVPAAIRLRALLFWAGILCVSLPLSAGPVLHEKFEPDPAEDLRFGATTPSGSMPAALRTRSGLVSAPSEATPSMRDGPRSKGDRAYGGASTPDSVDATYHVDRLTTRPDRVRYDEPFRPSVLPFKRLYAFDRLKSDLSFGVRDKALTPLAVGGTADDSEDAFFADFEVDLVEDVPVRIPSVGPGARVRALHVDPPVPVELLEDSAENWFARSDATVRARVVMQVTVDRKAFGSDFASVGFEELAEHLPPFPESARDSARRIAQHVGAFDSASPAQALSTLVDYFRRFKASSRLPRATGTKELYVELSLDQKGVCRHRAYAFAITALYVGIPTRVIHNEAHAWVEVYDGQLWHRIDLGGAASRLDETRPDPTTPRHRPPSDPHSWPRQSQPGLGLAPGRASSGDPSRDAEDGGSGNRSASDSSASDSSASDSSNTGWPSASESTVRSGASNDRDSSDSHVSITLRVQDTDLSRGTPLRVSGRATLHGRGCSLSRIDFFIDGPGGPLPIGSVATDRNGNFLGPVSIPRDAPVGNQTLRARIGAGCD